MVENLDSTKQREASEKAHSSSYGGQFGLKVVFML